MQGIIGYIVGLLTAVITTAVLNSKAYTKEEMDDTINFYEDERRKLLRRIDELEGSR